MYGGKTTKLSNAVKDHEGLKHKSLLIGHTNDDRGESGQANSAGILSTHQLTPTRIESVESFKVSRLSDVPFELISKADIIAVDECQFFNDIIEDVDGTQKDDIMVIKDWAFDLGKKVYVAGLVATSEGKMFGNYYKLIPFARHFHHRPATCVICMKMLEDVGLTGIRPYAVMTLCLSEKDGDVLVGGKDQYIASCENHWNEAQIIGVDAFCKKYKKHIDSYLESE